MALLRYCTDEGILLGGKSSLSPDPCEYSNGCNRIRCTRCEVIVRSGPAALCLRHDVFDERAHLAALYAAEDWNSLPFVQSEPQGSGFVTRLYACRCTAWEERDMTYLVGDPKENMGRLTWVCAGHPCPSLPLSFGAFTVSNATDWNEVVDRISSQHALALEGAPHLAAPVNKLIWLYHYLVGLPTADELSLALARRLAEREAIPMVAAFFAVYPQAKGVEKLVSLLKASLLDPGSSSLPDDVVKMILDRGVAVFSADDLLWLATNIGGIDKRSPGRWMAVMKLLLDRLSVESEFLLVIAGTGVVESRGATVDQLRSWVANHGASQSVWAIALSPMLKDGQPDRPGAN